MTYNRCSNHRQLSSLQGATTSYKTDKINKESKSSQKKCQASDIFPYEGSN